MGTMQKAKGKAFENKVADILHRFLMQNNDEYNKLVEMVDNDNLIPHRDFSSGVFAKSDGDIDLGLAKKYFPFSIECKHHKDLNLSIESVFKDKIKKVYEVWEQQLVPKANRAKLDPLLIFKANRTDIYCMFDITKIDVFLLGDLNKYMKMEDKIFCRFDDFLKVYFKVEEENA